MTKRQTTTSGMDWNTMLGLSDRIKRDEEYRDYLLITMGCYFGLRIGDLLSIKWCDVINKEELVIQESKTKKSRTISFNEKVVEAINLCSNELRSKNSHWNSEYVFANRWGGQLSVSYINKRLKVIFGKYNVRVQNPSSHTLRKTFGKRIYEMDGQSDRSLIYLSDIFGHSSTAITRSYIGITQDQIKDVYLSL
jgi:integrase